MLKYFILSALALLILGGNPGFANSKETMKVLMGNEWIGRYKKLKTDLENKVARAKDLENLSEKDIADIRDSYVRTSLMLENWLLRVVESIEINNQYQLNYLSKGDLSPELQASFRDIVTAYANDFTSGYEEITGIRDNLVLNLPSSGADNKPMAMVDWNVQHEELLACITPLLPGDWNSIN